MDNSQTVWRSATPEYRSGPKPPKKFCVSHVDPLHGQAAECQPPTAILFHHLLRKETMRCVRSIQISHADEPTHPLPLRLSSLDTIAAFNYIGL